MKSDCDMILLPNWVKYNAFSRPSLFNSSFKYTWSCSNLSFANNFLCKWRIKKKRSEAEIKTEQILERDKRKGKLSHTNEILYESNIFILNKLFLPYMVPYRESTTLAPGFETRMWYRAFVESYTQYGAKRA